MIRSGVGSEGGGERMIRHWTRKLGGFGRMIRRVIRSAGDGGRIIRLPGSEILRNWAGDPRAGESRGRFGADDPRFLRRFGAPKKKAVKIIVMLLTVGRSIVSFLRLELSRPGGLGGVKTWRVARLEGGL